MRLLSEGKIEEASALSNHPERRRDVAAKPRAVEVVPADGLSIAVSVPPGDHTVHFVYRPNRLTLLLTVSAMAIWMGSAQ